MRNNKPIKWCTIEIIFFPVIWVIWLSLLKWLVQFHSSNCLFSLPHTSRVRGLIHASTLCARLHILSVLWGFPLDIRVSSASRKTCIVVCEFMCECVRNCTLWSVGPPSSVSPPYAQRPPGIGSRFHVTLCRIGGTDNGWINVQKVLPKSVASSCRQRENRLSNVGVADNCCYFVIL